MRESCLLNLRTLRPNLVPHSKSDWNFVDLLARLKGVVHYEAVEEVWDNSNDPIAAIIS